MAKTFYSNGSFFILFSVIIICFSCFSEPKTKSISEKSLFDTLTFPKTPFSTVTLFCLDSSQGTTIDTDSGRYINKAVFEYAGNAGYSFINKQGEPKTKNYKSYKLDSFQIIQLEKFLIQQPCTDSEHLEKECAPVFRNVFIFYDENKKPVAQTRICLQCEMSSFYPEADYMCDFDNKVNFALLKSFIESIKSGKVGFK